MRFRRPCSSRPGACARPWFGRFCRIHRRTRHHGHNSLTVLSHSFRVTPQGMPKATIKPQAFATLYEGFTAPVSRFDCGRKCAPLNGGEPVCCSTQNAVPVVHKVEFDLLKTRTDLWSKFKPYDYPTKQIVPELTSDSMAIHCKGARHCERDNRTIACRGFPFFPYITRKREFVGVGTYWVFEDRCWMMSNLEIVDKKFVEEFVATYEALFIKDASEFTTYVDFSASAR